MAYVITARRNASAVLAVVVCPSVRLSLVHAGIVSQESCDIAKMTAGCADKSKQPHLHLRSRDSVDSVQPDVMDIGV